MPRDPFRANKCHVCGKYFCCPKCRSKHENSSHNFFEDCNVCVYGRTMLKNPSQDLLEHIKTAHWPLHCVYCKKEFATAELLLSHTRCDAFEIKKLSKTPFQGEQYSSEVQSSDFLSPPLTEAFQFSVVSNKKTMTATSTPMNNRRDEQVSINIPKSITPVDHSLKKNGGAIKRKNTDEDLPGNCKVTFAEGSAEIIEKGGLNSEASGGAPTIARKSILKSREPKAEVTNWESALMCDLESPLRAPKNECNITICNNIKQEVIVINSNNYCGAQRSGKFFSFMAETVRSVVQAFIRSSNDNFQQTNSSIKRPKIVDSDDEVCPKLKKMKLREPKCRRPIHDFCSLQIYPGKPFYVDKWTQTD